jgi:hypothetical protein
MVMPMKLYYKIAVVVKLETTVKDVKDIRYRDIFDIFFCLTNVNNYIRGPPYQFKFKKT